MQTELAEIESQSDKSLLFDQPLPSPHVKLTVVVPVRNEAYHLIDTLDALRLQKDSQLLPINPACFEVLLLANNCTDYSYEVAVLYQQQYPDFALHVAQIHLPPAKANIGTVRRLLMDAAYRRLMQVDRQDGIIASTDGDTVVDSQWVYNIMLEIAKGNDAVGGRILTQPEKSQVRIFHLRDVTYRTLVAKAESLYDPCQHDPWPRHFQHFGASIAVTCRMYDQAGGLPEKPFLEDEAFYRAMIRMDARVRKSPLVKVFTSTRTQGRVAVGFSEQLRYWSAMTKTNACQLAQPAKAIITQLRNKKLLRSCWQQRLEGIKPDMVRAIASELFLDPTWLATELRQSRFFGLLWEKVDEKMATGQWALTWQPVPIIEAIRDLRTYLSNEPLLLLK